MKPLQGDSVNNNSCSCTSCDSKSESDRQTLKRLLVQGSKINRLLTGKYYLHLRDSRLLETLIKTRALYDALRSELLSSTESSTADLEPRQSSREITKAFVEAKKSNDIFTLVDLVDKGAVIGLKKLSECCSCCTCSSKFRLRENVQKGRRNRQGHAGGNIASRSSLVSKQETGEAKNIKSEPCTCACYKHANIKKSREITEKIRPGLQIIERDRLYTASNDHKSISLNNGKMRKSYHKLKRAKAYPSPYIENIGEGRNKTISKSKLVRDNAIKKKKSIESLKLAQKTILDSFEIDRETLKQKEPVASSMALSVFPHPAKENMVHVKKTAIKTKDQVVKRQAKSPKLTKKLSHSSINKNQTRKENAVECLCKINYTPSTSNTSIQKGTLFIAGNEQRNQSKAEKLNKKLLRQATSLANTNTEISKKSRESFALGESNQVQNSKKGKMLSRKDPVEVINTPGKEPIKPNTVTKPGILKSVSIKKSYSASRNKTSSNSLHKINKSKMKSRSSVLIRKKLRMLSTSLRFRPHPPKSKEPSLHKEPARHKKLHLLQNAPRLSKELRLSKESCRHKKLPGFRQKNLKSGSHALKRCLCTLKLKLNETKSKISKNVSNENLNVKDKQSINSKNLLSSIKTLIKSSNLNLHDPEYMTGHATNCDYSDYVNQNQAMRRNKPPPQNETNAYLAIHNATNDTQDISNKETLSKHASVSECMCPELEELEKNPRRTLKEFGVKSTSNDRATSNPKKKNNAYECECFDANISSEDKGRYKAQRVKSKTRLKKKSTLKDESITTAKPWKLQNQSVQTVINITKSKQQKPEIEISMKQLDKKKPYTGYPKFSIELLNKGYSSSGLIITQSKVKFVYKCDGTKQLPNKQSQTSSSTRRSKLPSTKHGLRRCFCTLQLGKTENKKYNQRKVSKVSMIQPNSKVEESQSQAKLKRVRHDQLPCKYNLSICSPKICFSRQLKIILIKGEERNLKKRIKTKSGSNFSLTSRSMQLPRTKQIHSIIISKSERLRPILKRNKTKSSDVSTHRIRSIFSRKLYKSKRSYCLCFPTDKDNKLNKDTKIRSSKDLQKSMILRNKKQEHNSLLDLTNKRCLCTFKLRKKGKLYQNSSVVKTDTKSNIIAGKINPKFQNNTKLTKSREQRPYETKYLEPFVSIKNKSTTFKHFGKATKKTRMKSKSSDTRTLRNTSKSLFVESDLQQRNTSLQKFKEMRKSSECHLPEHAREEYLDNFLKQSVKMGSNFSFNVQFYKGITPERNFNQNRSKNMNVHLLHNKQKGNLFTKLYSSNQSTRLGTKRVSAMANSCLNSYVCSLKTSKMDEQRRNSKLLLPFETKKLTEVYAVSTVAIADGKLKTPEILEVDHDFHCIDSYNPLPTHSKKASNQTKQWQYFKKSSTSDLSISMIAFKTKNVQSYIRVSKYKSLQINSMDQGLLDFSSNESVRFETAFSCEIDYLKNSCSKKRRILRTAQSQNDRLAIRQHTPENPESEKAQNITHLSQLTGVQRFLRRCYCTMNIQVAHQKRKLLDYECEPGICIPGDCDPYECQKLIMKRLMRQVSRMSGTESRSRSSSCETTSTGSCTKKLQSGFDERKHRIRGHDQSDFGEKKHRMRGDDPRSRPVGRSQGLKYQSLPRTAQVPAPALAHRQAVRIGSALSFSIEFSKGSSKSAPTTDFVKLPKRQTSSRSSKTYYRRGMERGTKYVGHRHHRETQSMMKQMRHRASSVTPMLKRCFCTLKLQKKGRQQKELELRGTDHGTSTPPEFSVEKPILRTTERGQNTKRNRRFPELLPHECEPGICVPGECDPYECLELIKRRNKHTTDLGTDSMASSTSSSTMTSSQKRKRKGIQSRNIRAKQVRSRDTSFRCKPSRMSIDKPVQDKQIQDRQVPDRPSKPSRQAVKISSNLSFNIEFYKDKTGGNKSDRQPSDVYVHNTSKKVRKLRNVPKNVYAHRGMRESSSQHKKRTRNDDSQIGIYQRGRSTMTSGFLKRCFCTAKLQGINVDAAAGARQHGSLKKLKRCLCTLKLMSPSKRRSRGGNEGHERATPILDKRVGMTQTRGRAPPLECDPKCEAAVKTQTRDRFPALLPYECEPGVCEPGLCDPHECIQLIRQRTTKEKMTGTTGPKTTSISSYYSSTNPSRAAMTQSRSVWPKAKQTHSRTAQRKKRGIRRDYASRERDLQGTVGDKKGRRRDYASRKRDQQETVVSPVSPQRQAVRIGSNFSFNVEFYKDKVSNNLDVQAATPLDMKSRPIRVRERSHGAYRRIKTRDKGLRGRRFPALSRDSQMDPTKSKDVGLGPILRRCFCTLKLQKQSKNKVVTKDASKAASEGETKAAAKAETKATSKHKCLCTPPIKEVATLHTKSVMTAKKKKKSIVSVKKLKESIVTAKKSKDSIMTAKKSKESVMTAKIPKKRKAFPYELKPYECEPGICVPGECDPYECLKLINKRLMYSSGTSTDRRATRSTSNMANYGRGHRNSETQSFMYRKKPMRARDTRTRYRERSPYTERRPYTENRPYTEKRAYREKRPESRSTEHGSTVVKEAAKQAVKLGSSFNFDIEFFKDKSHGGPVVTSRPIKRDEAYAKPRKTTSRSTEWRSSYSRHKKAQFARANRDMDSQGLGPSMRSTRTGTAAPFLKRCFCTLQLHCLCDVSKRDNVKSPAKLEASSAEKKNISGKQAQCFCYEGRSRELKPYECEPGFCVPGECDPYECLKIIKKRMQSKKAGTKPYKRLSVSSSTDREKKIVPRKQVRSYSSRKNVKTSPNVDQLQDMTGSRSISSTSDEKKKQRPTKKARSHSPNSRFKKTSPKNVKTRLRNGKTTRYDDQFQVDTSPNRRAVRIGSNFSLNVEFFKDKSPQVPSVREVTKIIKKDEKNTENKRCAKKEKVPRSNITKKETVPKTKTTQIVASEGRKDVSRDVQLQSQSKRTDTKGVGTPVLKRCFCTLKLEKKGKRRYITPTKIEPSFKCVSTHTKSKTKAEIEPVAREIGTETKYKNCKCNTQKPNDNSPKAKKYKSNIMKLRCLCKKGASEAAREQMANPDEFPCKKGKECKCSTCKCNTYAVKTTEYVRETPLKQDQNIISVKHDSNKPKKPVQCKCDKNIISVKTDKNIISVKNDKKIISVKNDSNKPEKPVQCQCDFITSCGCKKKQTSDKKTSTKGKHDPLQKLDPKPISRVSNMAAQFIPGYTHKRTKYKGEPYSPENIQTIVEEPRFPFFHGKDARQGVKITSNFSFNIEFYKEMLPPVDEIKKEQKKNEHVGHGNNKYLFTAEPDRTKTTSSPVAKLRKLQKSLCACRVEEIRTMPFFQPREYWVQYQTQQTKKYFKTKPQELETIMSYARSKYDKINNERCSCLKTNFGLVDPTKKGAHLKGIPKHSDTKESTLKKMFYYCKNLFTKPSIKKSIKNTEGCTESKKKTTNKQPWIDILKPSKSERHPNKAAIADFKKSKSLKVAKVSGKDDYKKKYSRFQSGDHQGTKPQKTGIKFKKNCQHCQIKFKHAMPIHEKGSFTTLRTHKALKLKPNDAIVTEQKKDTTPVSFLFKSLKFKNCEDVKYFKLCSCCGGIKRISNRSSASKFLDMKNKLLEYSEDATTTVLSKNLIAIPTKIDIPEAETALTQENQKNNKQTCPSCVCKHVSKPKTKQGKKVCKREAERRAKNTHHADCIKCKTMICPAESEKEALVTKSGYYRAAPNQKKRKKNLKQEAKTRENFHKAEDKEIVIDKKIKETCKSQKLMKCKNMPKSLLVAESVLDISKLELKSTGDILSNLQRAVSDPKGLYRKCQSYLRDPMRSWIKFQKPGNNGPGVDTLQCLKLRCQASKCVKECEEKLEDYSVINFGKHSNNADRKKGFHPKKPSWRRHAGCGFGWSPFMLSLRKKPWLSASYKCPHCLILQAWRQFMDIILFLLAVAVSSPCLLGVKLCRALKCCFLCTG